MPVRCIGVNNRDLKTFKVSLETTLRLKPLAPKGCTLVSESGIRSADDVARLKAAGCTRCWWASICCGNPTWARR